MTSSASTTLESETSVTGLLVIGSILWLGFESGSNSRIVRNPHPFADIKADIASVSKIWKTRQTNACNNPGTVAGRAPPISIAEAGFGFDVTIGFWGCHRLLSRERIGW